jgi:C1A family cysteine protease
MGFRRDLPDFRDLSFEDHEIQGIFRISTPYKAATSPGAVLPASVDLRKWCTRVRDQGALHASTAFAVTGLIEYFDRRAFAKHTDYSALFLYRATRDLLGIAGDDGAELRSTLKALATFGIPAFCYSFDEQFRTMRYFRLDGALPDPKATLLNLRRCLAARMPAVFGLSIYSSFPVAGEGSEIRMPEPGERLLGGQALMAVGYDDERMIGPDQGAVLVRNSWGAEWGDKGYAWLPYRYVEEGLAVDWWTLVRSDFVNTDLFN